MTNHRGLGAQVSQYQTGNRLQKLGLLETGSVIYSWTAVYIAVANYPCLIYVFLLKDVL